MRVKLLVVIAAVFALAMPAMAQKKNFSIGMRFGAGLSQLNFKDKPDDYKALTIGNLGVYSVIRPNQGPVSITAGLSYFGQGYQVNDDEYVPVGNLTADPSKQWVRTYYHNLALDLGGRYNILKTSLTPYVGAGLRTGYRLGVTKWASEEWAKDIVEKELAKAEYEEAEKLMLNGVINAGLQTNIFFVELEYSPAITPVQKADDFKARLATYGLNFGFVF